MPKEMVIKCDCGCSMTRLQSNNWIQAEINAESFKSWKWNDKRANRKGILFLATEECAHKLYSRWLASRMHKPQEVGGNETEGEIQVEEAVGREDGSQAAID
jgi:hypothetical protein